MSSLGRLVRTADLALSGSSASFSVREVPPDAMTVLGCLEAGLVLSSPGATPFLLWARFLAGPGAVDDASIYFHLGGVGVSGSCAFVLPWVVSGSQRATGQAPAGDRPWNGLTGWAGQAASDLGHPAGAASAAIVFLADMVLEPVADVWAASLVRRACGIVSPDRVVELAREAAVEQVMGS